MQATAHPRVSVVIPAYNNGAYLREAIASVHRQTFPVYEIIVVDDGSTDDTAALAETLGAHVIRQANAGPAVARNTGIHAAAGEWIAFLDADDLWMEHKLERQMLATRQAPEIGLIFSDYLYFDERGTHQKTGFDLEGEVRDIVRTSLAPGLWRCDRASAGAALARKMFMFTSTVVVRRDMLLGDALFDDALRCAEDYELFLRLIVRTEVACADEALVAYRRHASSVTTDLDLDLRAREQLRERCAAQPSRYPPGTADCLAREQARYVARSAFMALRAGSFAVARKRALQSLSIRLTPAALAVLPAASLCDNALGRGLHAVLRRMWTRRPGKYRAGIPT
jgi:hypothetical protein